LEGRRWCIGIIPQIHGFLNVSLERGVPPKRLFVFAMYLLGIVSKVPSARMVHNPQHHIV